MAAFVVPTARRPRKFRRVNIQTEDLDDDELRRRYRFGSCNLDRLEGLIGDRLRRGTNRNCSLTPRQQILIALRFFASGCFLQLIGDTFGVDIATVSRTVTLVTDILFDLRNRFIRFPTTDDERRTVQQGFYQIRRFPGIVGCIDGTHVRIISPPKDQEMAYVNRKRYHSINVQATCDHLGQFTSINAAWPGSAHDSHVLRVSSLCRYLEANHHGLEKGVLLGDSGYPCRPFLLTPFLNPANEREERYNRAHMCTRNAIERMFGVWKRKFHVLHSEIRMKPAKVSRIIVACAVLHNLAILWKEPLLQENESHDEQPEPEQYQGQQDGRGIRSHVVNNFFN